MGKQKKTPAKTTAGEDEELHRAARSGDLENVQRICGANPLAINARDKHSRTPLHLAAWSGHTKVVDYLCKKADVGAAAMDDMGAIHFAAQKGHTEVVRILLSAGVSIKSYNRKGMTALHYAAQGSHLELVKYLVKKGADVNSKNKAGNTPIDLSSSEEVRTFLVEYQTTSTKKALDGNQKNAEAQSTPSLQEYEENADREVLAQGEDHEIEKDESIKRKKEEDTAEELLPQTKRSKVALKHLLASDDTQDEEE